MSLMTIEDFYRSFKNQQYVEQLKKIPQNFKVEHDDEEGITEITIYGVIGDSWWNDSFSANDIDKAIKEAGDNDIVINLNSPGGDAFDGISIYNRLKRHKGKVTIYVDGWACSAASVIAMAADHLIMGLGSMMMIHEAWSFVIGSKTDMRKEADVLEELEEGMIDIYMTKANISREEIREKLDAETWFSASSAVKIGFADEAEGSDDTEEEESIENKVRTNEDRNSILNELQIILQKENNKKENEQKEEPKQSVAAKHRRVLF